MLWDIIAGVFGIGKEIAGGINKSNEAIIEGRDKSQERQARINEAEISGAPSSGLRLWRSFLGWALALSFVWEVVARPIIMTYFPKVALPPSFIKETTSLLLGMLGLGL